MKSASNTSLSQFPLGQSPGLVLYLGLVVLFVWRFLSGWRLCGAWMEYANYCMCLGRLMNTMFCPPQ